MRRAMRRKELETTKELALSLFDNCTFATLATVCPDGTPYCIPISIVRNENAIYFHGAMEGEKVDNLRQNPAVCLSCVAETWKPNMMFSIGFESAVAFGQATEITDVAEKLFALRILSTRHDPENMPKFDAYVEKLIDRTGVWKIEIEHITGKTKRIPPK